MPTALVCEDDEALRRLMRMALSAGGYDVVDAESVAGALDALTSGRVLDVFLCDYRMPVSSGIDALEAAARLRPGMPLLLVTGDEAVVHDPAVLAIPGLGVLQKPFTINALLAVTDAAAGIRVREITGSPAGRRAGSVSGGPGTGR